MSSSSADAVQTDAKNEDGPDQFEIDCIKAASIPMEILVIPADITKPCYVKQTTRGKFDPHDITGGFIRWRTLEKTPTIGEVYIRDMTDHSEKNTVYPLNQRIKQIFEEQDPTISAFVEFAYDAVIVGPGDEFGLNTSVPEYFKERFLPKTIGNNQSS